jgi:hypothetical protein
MFCVIAVFGSAATTIARAPANVALVGFAWSDNVGWIQFDAPGDPVEVERDMDDDGISYVTGYAWNESASTTATSTTGVGWIKFGGLGTSPEGGSSDAQLNLVTGELTGWARACAGAANPDCTGGATSTSGGWDGWIKLSDTTAPAYSVIAASSSNTMQGFSWGSTGSGGTASSSVIGWIGWTHVSYTPPCSGSLQCTGTSTYNVLNQWCTPVDTGLTCPGGTSCTPGGCTVTAPPTGSISINPLAVRPGGTTQVSWDAVAGADSCSVVQRNPGGSGVTIGSGIPSGSVSSNPVENITIFGLVCTNAAFPGGVEVASTTLRILPTLIET